MKFNPLEVTELPPVEADALLAALDTLGVAWWTKDRDGRYLRLNAAGHALLGLSPGDALGHTDAELLPPATASALRTIETSAVRSSAPQTLDQAADFNGQRRQLACATLALPPADNADGAAVLGAWLDVTELRHREAELRSVLTQLEVQQDQQRQLRAEIDGRAAATPMRLVRREQFEDQLSREIDLSLREHREFAVVYIAIDPLDPPVGDGGRSAKRARAHRQRLRRIAAKQHPRDGRAQPARRRALCLVALGRGSGHRARPAWKACAASAPPSSSPTTVRCCDSRLSMGVASYPHTSQTQAGLQRAADTALEQAQRRGGNHVALASIAFGGPPSVM